VEAIRSVPSALPEPAVARCRDGRGVDYIPLQQGTRHSILTTLGFGMLIPWHILPRATSEIPYSCARYAVGFDQTSS
jgi:hypothetical protein